ncbi:hypothetical protein, partial [Aeromonas veronii]|uniref:hypothetical protein n=1 Tax=Aeromonas veronii TaxID=654 RepID=UPI002B48A4BB
IKLDHKRSLFYIYFNWLALKILYMNGRYEIPYYKLGNRTLYERTDLDAFLASRKMLHTGKPANPLQ